MSTVIVPLVLGSTMLFHLLAGPSKLKLVIVALSQTACVPSGLTVPVGAVLNVTDPVKLVPTGGKNVGAVELVMCPPKFHVTIIGASAKYCCATEGNPAKERGELKSFSSLVRAPAIDAIVQRTLKRSWTELWLHRAGMLDDHKESLIPPLSLMEIAAIVGKIAISIGAWGASMNNYQFYLLDRQGHTARPPRVASFKDDESALAEARKTLGDQTIEIWQGDRCVATLLQMQRVA